MFDIEYKGGNGVVLTTKKGVAVIDPRLSVVGLKDLSVKDAVVIATEERFSVKSPDMRLEISGPGEYEVGPFAVRGVPASRHIDTPEGEKKSTIYQIGVGDVRIAVLGNITPQLSDEQMEEVGVIDILILPVGGGGYTLDATSAASIVRQMEPKVVIPVSYADDALKYEVPQESLEVFTQELGAPVETVAKFKLKSAAALPASLTVVEVTRS